MANCCVKELAYTCVLLLISSSWGLTMGYWSSAQKSFEEDFHIGQDYNTSMKSTLFNLLAPGACICGGPIINLFVRKCGRKIPAAIIAGFAFASWIALGCVSFASSDSLPNLFPVACVFRVFLGISVGATSTVVPMYITELAPPALSGAFGTLHQVGISIGASFCYALGCIPSFRWGQMALCSAIPTGLNLILIWFIPESPVVGRQEEVSHDTGAKESLCQRKFVRPFVISLLLMVFQQYGGTSAFLANLQKILDDAGSALDPKYACLLVGVAGAVASLIGSPLVGHFGRKVMWFVSSVGQTAALFIAAGQEKWQWNKYIPVIMLFLDNFIFGLGTAPIPWFFVPELFPDSVRSLAASIITAFCWIIGTALFFIWDVMKENIGQAGGFLVFGVIMALSTIFSFFLPTPKPRDENEMESYKSAPLLDN